MTLQIKSTPEKHINRVRELMISDNNQEFLVNILGFKPTIPDILKHTKGDPDFNPKLFFGAYFKGELIGSILAVRRSWKQGREQTGFLKWIFVKFEFRRRGIGKRLIENCERELRLLGCKTLTFGNSAPLYLVPGVPNDDGFTQKLLEDSGWSKQTSRISLSVNIANVDIDVQGVETFLQVNKSISIGVANKKHFASLFTFIKEEFSRSWAVETTPALEDNQQAFCCYVADKESGGILGFAAINASNPNWFGPMGVKSEKRKAGLGGLLVQYSLLMAQDRNMKRLMFPWVNESEMFYRKILGSVVNRLVFIKYEKIIV